MGKFVYEENAIPWLSCVALVDMANLNQGDGGVCVCVCMCVCVCVCARARVLSHSALCSHMECSTPCSSVHGIVLAKILE